MTREEFYREFYPDYQKHEAKMKALNSAWGKLSIFNNQQAAPVTSVHIGKYEVMLEDWKGKAPKGNSVEIEGKWYYDLDAAISLKFPDGYRLPARKEWKEICDALGNNYERLQNELKLGLNGYVYEGELNSKGSYGYYWSSSCIDTAWAYYLGFNSGGSVNPQNSGSKYNGFAVRCLKNY